MIAKISSLVFCAVMAFLNAAEFIGTEFGEGGVTGLLVKLCLAASAIFVLGVAAIIWLPKVSGVLAGIAALLCLPLYICRIVPVSLLWISSLPVSAAPATFFVFDEGVMLGLLALIIMVFVCFLAPARSRANAFESH